MRVIVTDAGFAPDDLQAAFTRLAEWDGAPGGMVEVAPDDDPSDHLSTLLHAAVIRVAFPIFSDGRGFSHAIRLRGAGFAGRLRASGHVLADQYAMARRAGFDEVEITQDLAARHSAGQWQARAAWRAHDYQSRLRAAG